MPCATVQIEQTTLLRCLIKHHGLRRVYCEGISNREFFLYKAKIAAMKALAEEIPAAQGQIRELASRQVELEQAGQSDSADYRDVSDIKRQFEDLLYQHRLDLLEIGAAGQLLMTGELDEVLPVEDADLLDKANPVAGNDQIRFDAELIQARQDAQVRALTKRGGFAFVILGGTHDLSDNADALPGGTCECLAVTTRRYCEFAAE